MFKKILLNTNTVTSYNPIKSFMTKFVLYFCWNIKMLEYLVIRLRIEGSIYGITKMLVSQLPVYVVRDSLL